MRFETKCVQWGVDKDANYHSATTPIYPTSTFRWEALEPVPEYDYTRSGNPTRKALEENLAALEGGVACQATSSGMSAITTAIELFAAGDHIICNSDIYGGTFRLFHDVYSQKGLQFSFLDMSNLDEIRSAITPSTKCIWIETPSNPLMKITDIAAVAGIAREQGLITIADNTFLSPYLQRPMEHGVDVVVHSTTKYLNGHSDVVGGCVISRTEELGKRVHYITNAMGVTCSPFDAWLVLRGVKTLGPRMEAHQRSARAVVNMLSEHPEVERVYYPGLEDHPGHAIAKKQQAGFGAMLSFDVKQSRPFVEKILSKLKLFQLAESLGGVESLIEYPAMMSHASMTPEARSKTGITEKTLRVSVGIEHPDDLVADLQQALA